MLLAEVGPEWVNLLITGLVTAVGGGGLASVVTTWLNNRREEKKEQRLDVNTMTLERLAILERRDRECNDRVNELERRNNLLETECQKLLRRLLDIENKLVTAVISADSNMKIVTWNEGATLMFGYLASDMIGGDVDVLVPGYLKQKHHDAYAKAINDLDGSTNWINSRPAVGVHKDGHEFNIRLLVTSYKNSAGAKFFEARISKPQGGADANVIGVTSDHPTRIP